MKDHCKGKRGYTLIELLIVIGIAVILLTLTTINLVKAQRNTSITGGIDTLVADIKTQQIKAMSGATNNVPSSQAFGVHFESDNYYILFHGTTFDPNDPANITITLDDPLSVYSSFPNDSLVFEPLSGNVVGFSGSTNAITVANTAGSEQKVILINQYGVISEIQ